MTPEQIIQAAWVARSNADLEALRADGFLSRQTTWPVWAPEEAVKALRNAVWTPPARGCGPTPDEKEFAETAGRILDSPVGLDGLLRELSNDPGGEWPEVAS